jgi:hypothetical protein
LHAFGRQMSRISGGISNLLVKVSPPQSQARMGTNGLAHQPQQLQQGQTSRVLKVAWQGLIACHLACVCRPYIYMFHGFAR